MRIATFNLENLDDRPGLTPPLSERIVSLRPQLVRLKADVLCLQEVNGQKPTGGGLRNLSALDRLLEGTAYAAFHRAVSLKADRSAPRDRHNLVILSRWPLERVEQLHHDLVAPPLYRPATPVERPSGPEPVAWDRPILVASLHLPDGRVLHLLNLHLRAPLAAPLPGAKSGPLRWKSVAGWAEGFFLATIKRAGQALEARLEIERIFDRDPQALILVCGDFNAEEREMPLRTIVADVADTRNGSLTARSLVPLEHSLPASQRFSVLHDGRPVLLDHLLVSRGLLAHYQHMEIHNEALGDELVAFAKVERSPESFHAPVVASFALPDASSV